MLKIKYLAPFLDNSGYGQAARNSLIALNSVSTDMELSTEIVSFSNDKVKVGDGYELARKLQNKLSKYDVKITELTPDFFPNCKEDGVYNIGFMFWEVVGVKPLWVWSCNQMDEIWTSSYEHANILRTFGVRVPITVFPIPIDTTNQASGELHYPNFRFYSIFQWTERKNPFALLVSYFQEFHGNTDVSLILKTYRANYSNAEKGAIVDNVESIKRKLQYTSYPKVDLILDEISTEEMTQLHADCDVFVSAHRGEGWGMPQLEAMNQGNPIISTNWGGVHHWLTNESAWLVPFKFANVFDMGHIPWYDTSYLWADVDKTALKKAMREAYENKDLRYGKGELARSIVENCFSYKVVGSDMKDRLLEVTK